MIDGSKALRSAIDQLCGDAARVQRCRIHKLRNVTERLPKAKAAQTRWVMIQALKDDADAGIHKLKAHAKHPLLGKLAYFFAEIACEGVVCGFLNFLKFASDDLRAVNDLRDTWLRQFFKVTPRASQLPPAFASDVVELLGLEVQVDRNRATCARRLFRACVDTIFGPTSYVVIIRVILHDVIILGP